jgi:biotin carboxyl carrier protein
MKLKLTLQHGTRSSEHQIELQKPRENNAEAAEIVLDGERQEADWAEVSPGIYSLVVGGRSYEVHVMTRAGHDESNHASRIVKIGPRYYDVTIQDPRQQRSAHAVAAQHGPQEILAPMPGKIVKVLVERNQEVALGTGLLVIEAMKMQNELRAPRAGRVEEICVKEGKGVEAGARLLRLA